MNLWMVVNTPAAHPVQQLAKVLAPADLHRRQAEDVRAALELGQKLVVEVVAAGQHRTASGFASPDAAPRERRRKLANRNSLHASDSARTPKEANPPDCK
jgi:hypothetical protein